MTLKKKYDSKLEDLVHKVCPKWEYHPRGWDWVPVHIQSKIAKAPVHLRTGMDYISRKKYQPDFMTPNYRYIEVKGLLDAASKSRWLANLDVVHLLSFSKPPPIHLATGFTFDSTELRDILVAWYSASHKSIPKPIQQGIWLPIGYKDMSWLSHFRSQL